MPFVSVLLSFLLKFYARYIGSDMGQSALEMTLRCLRAMNSGGIHDHVGQVRRVGEGERGREGGREGGT